MEIGLNAELDSSIDALEQAFSDSTRYVIRMINVEWARVLDCRKDLAAKEEELQKAMENMDRFREMKTQNENYLNSARKRLEGLKLSKSEHNKQMKKLEKEKEKVVKNCDEQEQSMRQKIEFYEEKWRKRYETCNSENPRRLAKIQRANEILELHKKLRNLTEEQKKYEKELSRVKFRRSIFTEQSKLYPFQNFVVNIAKLYLGTKQIYAECENFSREITDIERRIQSKREILARDKMTSSKNSLNVAQNFEENCTKVTSNLKINNEYTDVEMVEMCKNDNAEAEVANDVNIKSNINVEKENSIKCVKSFPNDLFITSNNANKNYLCNIEEEINISKVKDKDWKTKAAKVPNEPKARKWMERLKIFVPKFRNISEENDSKNDKNSTKPAVSANTQVGEKYNEPTKILNQAQYNNKTTNVETFGKTVFPHKTCHRQASSEPRISSLVKNVMTDDTTSEICDNSALQKAYFQNTSKYFKQIDEEVEPMDWDKELAYEKTGGVKSIIQDPVAPDKSEEKLNMQKKITETKTDLNKAILEFNESMDIDEQLNRRKFDSFIEKTKEPEAEKPIVKNFEMAGLLLQTNREEEITQSTERNGRSIYSFDSNDKKTINKFQNMNLDSSLPQTNSETESKSSLDNNVRSICSFASNEKKIMNKHQNANGDNSLLKINPEMESKSSLERNEKNIYSFVSNEKKTTKYQNTNTDRSLLAPNPVTESKSPLISNETSTYSHVLNEKEIDHKYRDTNSGEIQRDVPVQDQVDNNKKFIAGNIEPFCNNVVGDATKQHKLYHLLDTSILQAPVVSKNDAGKNTEIITPKKMNTHGESIQHIQTNDLQIDVNISNKSPISIPANRISHSPVKPSPKNSQSVFKVPTPPNPKTPSPMDSNLNTPLTRQLQNSGEPHVGIESSNSAHYKANSPSPGFAYTTRLMYPMNAANSSKQPAETITRDPQSSIFAQMAFLNQARSPEEEKSKFLADFEDYLADSPPLIKGTEKSMFAFAEDSPENEDKNDFFPLFASSNGDADKEKRNRGGAFTFNFNSDSQAQSPDENKGFKLMF